MTSTENWRTVWQDYEEPSGRGAVGDACNGVRIFTEGDVCEPETTIALAIAGAEAAEGLRGALESDWALYTPQQAAVVASAVFAQLDAAADSLRRLRCLLEHAEDRRETAFSTEAGERFEHAAVAVAFTKGFAGPVVRALEALPYLGKLPADAHETLAAVAALLGPDAKLIEQHGPGEYVEDDSGYGCGCEIRFQHQGEMWNLRRGDSSWDLVRESDGEKLDDGTTVYPPGWRELGAIETTAHPEHLVALIRAQHDEVPEVMRRAAQMTADPGRP